MVLCLLATSAASAQGAKNITLQEAINLGLQNSKELKLSQTKIDQAIAQYHQVKDQALPTGSVSYTYNHAEIPTTTFQMSKEAEPFHLPRRADAFIGTFSLQEVIFGGNRLRYAKQSTDLLTQVAKLDADKDKENVVFNIANAYFNLYKLQQSKKVVEQNLESVDQQIKRAQRFFEQGLVTKNDVLRFQLQRSNIELSAVDLETNRKVVVYNLNLMIGLPESTDIVVNELGTPEELLAPLTAFIDTALTQRSEIKALDIHKIVADNSIKSIKGEMMPSVLAVADAYYLNPNGKLIPGSYNYLAPIAAGVTVAWNFDGLWMNKNKISEAKIQRSQLDINKDLAVDNVKSEVNQSYQNYQKALDRIRILETSIAQARENDRMLESQYQNKVASATDRIDAETQLFQSLINLELAKADAEIAYYTLLKSTGTITK
ncbi:TolC family protein [Pontibacter silvestris]|uniref:TolC family protein n=1 Tax=Pontibacter silvestris TaxID=2305183 RepID=A0ABW4X1I2_9BACT|nr:TolC family protein [Pontibacter silvestris]MCC9136011.1 TolC family protein [Pontibacter silvestris]